MLQDVRYAGRILMQNKGWTVVVVLTLALGIGANGAIFSWINAALLRKLPIENPDNLIRFRNVGKNDMVTSSSEYGYMPDNVRSTFSYPMFEQSRQNNQTLTDIAASAPNGNVNLVLDGHAEIASAFLVSANFYGLLGIKAAFGRTLISDDDRPGAAPAAVISYGYWARRFGSNPNAVGKIVQANRVSVTIVGVLPPEFTGIERAVGRAPDISFPLALDPQLVNAPPGRPGIPVEPRLSQPTYWWLRIIGRLKPGVTAQQVEGNFDGMFRRSAREGFDSFLGSLPPQERGSSGYRNRTEVPNLNVTSASQGLYDLDPNGRQSMALISAVVALVLLIVCANVANLLLSRAAARQKEMSVRMSMGATRLRLMRQLLTESVIVALLGGTLGIAVAYWGKQLLPGAAGQAPLDWHVLAFTSALSLITGILFGFAPAVRATSKTLNDALKETGRSVIGSRAVLTKGFLILQVAISLVLLVGAGLFLQTIRNLRDVSIGFDPENIVLFRLNPQLNRYDPARIASLYAQIQERLSVLPDVRIVAVANMSLLSGGENITGFVVEGQPVLPTDSGIHTVNVGPNYFETLGIPLLIGRTFTVRDDQSAPKVAIINEAAAHKYFPNENPIGRRFGGRPEESDQIEIVGVVRDVKYNSLRDAAPPTKYMPFFQDRLSGGVFHVKTTGDPALVIPAIREAVRQIDPNLPVTNVSTQMEQIEGRFAQEKLFAQAYTLFGSLALLIASIGLFGLMSYSVTRRTNEIGIRMALGAQRSDVVQMVMRESLVLVCSGLMLGLATALAAGRLIKTLLFGLSPADASTIVVSVVVMIAVSTFAGYLPARRASRVDPMVALHYE